MLASSLMCKTLTLCRTPASLEKAGLKAIPTTSVSAALAVQCKIAGHVQDMIIIIINFHSYTRKY